MSSRLKISIDDIIDVSADTRPPFGCLTVLIAVLAIPALLFTTMNLSFLDDLIIPIILFFPLLPLTSLALWLRSERVIGAGSAVLSVLSSIVALGTIFSGTADWLGTDLIEIAMWLSILVGLVYGVIALITFRPPLRQLPVVLATMLGMFALFALAFAIGIAQGFQLGFAKLYAFALIATATFVLARSLRRVRQPSP